jgi:anhydro-N-acetylmuramic acid kinase
MHTKATFILGLMSGSSLDGLDLAYCKFFQSEEEKLEWEILHAKTMTFSQDWIARLKKLPGANAYTLAKTHTDFGRYLGQFAASFLSQYDLKPDLISSHGHTIFHYPNRGFTYQIGDGATLASVSGYNVADNFRMQDVAAGGQGAPLAPIVDQRLFPSYDFLLNLGGIANLTCKASDGYIAFDLTGANQVLNRLVSPLGKLYDDGGQIAASGTLSEGLLEKVESLDFFKQSFPKSLGNDWVQAKLIPIFLQYDTPVANKLYTACIHVARQIRLAIQQFSEQHPLPDPPLNLLATGGGVYNKFLMECIQEECQKIVGLEVHIPSDTIIQYKEALLMALMGYLRLKGQPNCLPSATGARKAMIGGALHLGWKQ